MSTSNLRRDLAAVLLLAGSLLSYVNAAAQSGPYNFVNIDYPGALFSAPNGVNNSGEIVGYWEDASGNIHGYLYHNGVYTSLDYPGAASTEAVGINNSGIISGWYVTTDDVPQGFTYSDGTFTSFTYPGSSRTNAKGINNHGEVVGFYGTTYSFVDSDGAFTSFGYPGARVTYAYGINDTGQIAGYYQATASGPPIGFFYDGQGTFTSIQYPDSTETFAYGINNSNVVVGQSADSGTLLGFLWQNGQFTVVGPPASDPLPFGINNNGQIVGVYFPGGVGHGFLGTPVGSSALQFVAVAPCRLVDTRTAGGPIQGGGSRNFTVPQLGGCGIPSSAAAYSLNVTAVPHGPLGYLTIWPAGQSQPTTSLLNSTDGRIKANAAIVPSGNNGAVSIFVSDTSDVVLDINGYFTDTSGSTLAFYPLTPCRVADTRKPNGPLGGPYLTGGQSGTSLYCKAGASPRSGAAAYSFNFTVVPKTRGTELPDCVARGTESSHRFHSQRSDRDCSRQCRAGARRHGRRSRHLRFKRHRPSRRHRRLFRTGSAGRLITLHSYALPCAGHARQPRPAVQRPEDGTCRGSPCQPPPWPKPTCSTRPSCLQDRLGISLSGQTARISRGCQL